MSQRRYDLHLPAQLLPPGEIGRQFCEALKGMIEGSPDSEKNLVRSIRAFARAEREQSLPPERTIVALKHLFHEVCLAPPHRDQLAEKALLDRIVSWCIQDYYSS